ncbi:hypothetical protein [Marinobacter sp. tcs-11]|uniref:hypothetical protein n=1 Tax=Marinobacter sp. tcs-11 TaxID=1742860 RepID=UPI002580C473|nr:hypothetical protein [Marinobacter sp. tcs-11]
MNQSIWARWWGWLSETVVAMDGEAERTWMYSQRVSESHPHQRACRILGLAAKLAAKAEKPPIINTMTGKIRRPETELTPDIRQRDDYQKTGG